MSKSKLIKTYNYSANKFGYGFLEKVNEFQNRLITDKRGNFGDCPISLLLIKNIYARGIFKRGK